MRSFVGALFVLISSCLADNVSPPERRVENNAIISEREPKVRIELPKSVQYVGADRWLLYDIADCELHGFVEADSQRKVAQLYWIQFEGYVSTRPELKYQYDSTRRAPIGGLEFIVDTFIRGKDDKTTSSDREHLKALIEAKGYTFPENMMSVRLVHLLNEQKRRELMIIYAEDLAPTGFSTPQPDSLAVICVYDDAGNLIETHEHPWQFWSAVAQKR